MKRLAIAMVASLALALALLLAACDDGGAPPESTPTRTPPADAAARFKELEDLRKAASFHVVYNEDIGYAHEKAEFAWLQDGGRVRWDGVSTWKGGLSGISSIDDGAESGVTCSWSTGEDNSTATVNCSPVPRGLGLSQLDRALNGGPLPDDVVDFSGFRTVLDVEVECYTATLGPLVRNICFSGQGVPLVIESTYSFPGDADTYSFTAMEIRSPPSEAELLTPIIPDAPLGERQRLRDVPLDDLVFPSMPIIEDWLAEAEE